MRLSDIVFDSFVVIVFVLFEQTALGILSHRLCCTYRDHYGSALEHTRRPFPRPRDERTSQTLVVDSIHV